MTAQPFFARRLFGRLCLLLAPVGTEIEVSWSSAPGRPPLGTLICVIVANSAGERGIGIPRIFGKSIIRRQCLVVLGAKAVEGEAPFFRVLQGKKLDFQSHYPLSGIVTDNPVGLGCTLLF
jgi:hypothetical protein